MENRIENAGTWQYRDFRIHYWRNDPWMVSYHSSTDYQYVHRDYDGPEDNRIGHGGSLQECIAQIDEWYEDQAG